MIKLLQYPISAKFGEIDSVHKVSHSGVDIATPFGTPVQSLTDGVVNRIINDDIIGNGIGIKLNNGKEIIYGHLSQININCNQYVKTGETLGLTGGTPGSVGAGRSTGAHIHIGLISNGQYQDPTNYLVQEVNNKTGLWDNIWHILTTPGTDLLNESKQSIVDSIKNLFTNFFHWIIQNSDYAILIAMFLGILAIFGSKRAVKGIYWTFAFYIILKFMGVVI